MNEPSHPNKPLRFTALTLAIVTVRAAAVKAAQGHDFALVDECNRELSKLEMSRDRLAAEMEMIGGA